MTSILYWTQPSVSSGEPGGQDTSGSRRRDHRPNYLEALAIGIEQDVYDERLAKLHMRHILVTTYGRYLGPEAPPIAELTP